ncbi:hypothetical protein OX459_10545 [Janthinobacterium sp. SUN026]|uniref:MvdC/MvdD family ATP grasp protein n=1 Tax=Janthinobacterium sp. SUN026 TaxID=3002438 RepID=UPI0025AF0CE6|nr:hypothetical protein [Janthinobacterium sp. SUN026]MDN2671829.1 hypothetical protein [Janthinobacterium sp. SUN026]
MKFLIPTQVYDTHALAVAAALNKRGHEAIRWFVADFPDRQTASVIMSNDQSPEMRVHGPRFSETFEDVDVLWFRRPTIPTVPGNIDPEDYPFAMQENCAFYQSVWSLLVDRASWINPYRERRLAKSKLYQLRLARETGLSIPRTLASNEPAVVRAFLAEGNKIYKPFRICEWSNEEGTALLQTAAISPEQVFSDHALQAAVGIYQERIHKKHELRVNYFGGKIIAVQLESQGNSKSALDWRAVAPEELAPRQVDLPPAVEAKCHQLMARLGLLFGCIDLMVTPDDDYVFLEVNEMGQFLWIERANPDIRMLDAFCDFLIRSAPPQLAQAELANTSTNTSANTSSYKSTFGTAEYRQQLSDDEANHARRDPAYGLAEYYI